MKTAVAKQSKDFFFCHSADTLTYETGPQFLPEKNILNYINNTVQLLLYHILIRIDMN